MPISRNYNGGSIVYFQGDTGNEVYVLQKGRVALISTALDTGEELKEEVKLGEFFGVKSALGGYMREETAQVLGKTTIFVFKAAEFEQFVLKNTRLIIKMMQVFSRQLRDVHRSVREILKADVARNPSFELLNVAESFYRNGNFDHAIYAFNKYLTYNPNGANRRRAEELLQMARKGLTYPIGYPPPQSEGDSARGGPSSSNIKAGMMAADQALDDPFALNMDPIDTDPRAPGARRTIEQAYEEGVRALEAHDVPGALKLFEECVRFQHLKNDDEQSLFAQAHYQLGVAQLKAGQFDNASNAFSNYIKSFPTGEQIKDCIFQLGVIAEATGNKERARSLYHKVATMPPPDDTTRSARSRLEKLGT